MRGHGYSSLGLIIFFTISVYARTDGEVFFLNLRNIQSILNTIVPVLLLGLGQTFVIISGGIDLSVGWVMGLSSVVSARSTLLLVDAGIGEFPAIGIGFGIALVGGILRRSCQRDHHRQAPRAQLHRDPGHGLRGAWRRAHDLRTAGPSADCRRRCATSVTSRSCTGCPGDGGGISFLHKPDVTGEALRSMDRVFSWPVVVTAITVVIAVFLLHKTQFGRHTFAIGGNREASVRAGVPADRQTILIFTLSAFTAGLAGILRTRPASRAARRSPVSHCCSTASRL